MHKERDMHFLQSLILVLTCTWDHTLQFLSFAVESLQSGTRKLLEIETTWVFRATHMTEEMFPKHI